LFSRSVDPGEEDAPVPIEQQRGEARADQPLLFFLRADLRAGGARDTGGPLGRGAGIGRLLQRHTGRDPTERGGVGERQVHPDGLRPARMIGKRPGAPFGEQDQRRPRMRADQPFEPGGIAIGFGRDDQQRGHSQPPLLAHDHRMAAERIGELHQPGITRAAGRQRMGAGVMAGSEVRRESGQQQEGRERDHARRDDHHDGAGGERRSGRRHRQCPGSAKSA
jgi:hypothetical protein